MDRLRPALCGLIASASLSPAAFSAEFVGKVSTLEIWSTGNAAFTLTTAAGYCNSQFIVNVSWPGAKNLIATLLAAKSQDRAVKVYSYVDSAGCVGAEGYGGNYIRPDYIYFLE